MANLTMTNWRIQDKLPYLNLGSAGENNASIVTITVDALIENANYYLDIRDENGSGLPNTQELKAHTSIGTNGETVYTLSMQPLVTWLGREGVKLLQVRCVYEENNEQIVKQSNVFHAKVDRNSGFVYKYDIAVFEEYLDKIRQGSGEQYVTEDELIDALRPYATKLDLNDKQNILQYEVLPEASVDELGKIYQYIGETNANYVNGSFYKCVSDGEAVPTYSWEIIIPMKQGLNNGSIVLNNFNNIASGNYSVAEGQGTQATNLCCHVEGYNSSASGQVTHAEGQGTLASGSYSHVEGYYSVAQGQCSHAQNTGTLAQGYAQTAIGKYNVGQGTVESARDEDYAFIIGNGTNGNRSNALAVQWDGTVVMQDNSTIKSAKTVYEVMGKMGAKNLILYPYYHTSPRTDHNVTYTVNNNGTITMNGEGGEGYSFYDIHRHSFILDAGEYIVSDGIVANKNVSLIIRAYNTSTDTEVKSYANTTSNNRSVKFTIPYEDAQKLKSDEWFLNIRLACNDSVFNNLIVYPMIRLADDQDDTWQPYVKTNYQLTQDVQSIQDIPIKNGTGDNGVIVNDLNNIASGNKAFALGISTQAIGDGSMAEGNYSISNGNYSHAEGNSVVNGHLGHGQNEGTRVQGRAQTAIGRYNVIQGNAGSLVDTDQALIIGNGTDNEHRSNALAVQWDGTVVFQDGSKQKSSPYAIMGELGAKNLISYPYSDVSQTKSGITWTINSDCSITANGTSTNYSNIDLCGYTNKFIPNANVSSYVATIGNGNWSGVAMSIALYDTTTSTNIWSKGVADSELLLSFTNSEIESIKDGTYVLFIKVFVNSGVTINNVTVYPMLRYADDIDSTWQPYAMTNKELTDNKLSITDLKSIVASSSDFADFQTRIATL